MLMYHRPLSNCCSCWAMVNPPVPFTKGTVALIVPDFAAGTVSGYKTPALTPGAAGPWIWEAVAFADKPVKETFTMRVFPLTSTTDPDPVPVRPPPDGTS